MSVRRMLAEIDSAELCEWRAYERVEPFGERVADARHGLAVSTLANINRDAKKKPDQFKPTDFIPWHECHFEPPKPIDPKVQVAQIKAMLRAAGEAANKNRQE